ncbi:MAG TPA: multidrug efflux RND transporter permease subunit [Planctomycetota bacterium]|jgi:HAE1 family hydrophobic/amphiphilic exporter-1
MLARFFVKHPIFANVIAILTMVVGFLCIFRLPVEQFPQITPPTIQVSTTYPGADSQVVADTVAAPIEQQVNGVEGMMFMSSNSANDGSYSLTVTFEVGTDLNMAQVLVQNRVAIAMPQLPPDVQRQGVTTKKQSTAITMFVTFFAKDEEYAKIYDRTYLANFAGIRIRDELNRLPGVGDMFVIPSRDYSMRIWLDAEKLQARGLTTQDVTNAIQEQNIQVPAGQVGQPPAQDGRNFQFTVRVKGRLEDAREFENIVIKNTPGGGSELTRLKDVAKVELGGKSYDQYFLLSGRLRNLDVPEKTGETQDTDVKLNAKTVAGIAVFMLPGANALDVARLVKDKMKELRKTFPPGLEYNIPLDITSYVEVSIHEVYKTIFEAGLLVLLVILVFLQDLRAVLVPATTVPVTLIGAFAGMAALGFSINMLTMFGLVLAIGIVVDDAIVIVEGAAHGVERGMTPRDATIKAMDELTGPIIGITLVLMSVFLPTIFLGGITGQIYQQFALTIAATAIISAINAMTLKPVQCAQWLRKHPEHPGALSRVLNTVFCNPFNYVYGKCEELYYQTIKRVIRFSPVAMLVYAGLIVFTGWLYLSLPTGFLPVDDQGFVFVGVQLPDGASQERTREVMDKIRTLILETPGVDNTSQVGGQGVDGTVASNVGRCFIRFKHWDQRHDPKLSMDSILAELRRKLSQVQEADVYVMVPPAIRGLGVSSGFQMQVQDRAGVGGRELQDVTNELVATAKKETDLLNDKTVRTSYRAEVPQVFVDVDRVKAKTMDMPLNTIFNTLQAYTGTAYVNDFNKFGRTFQVRVQADSRFRKDAEQIKQLRARNSRGGMVPLGTLINVKQTLGPGVISRYNLYPSAAITGEPAAGHSSGEALAKMEQLAESLPPSIGYEWTGMAFQERRVSGQALFVFGMAVLLVYLVLAAQYESWTLPAAVIFVVPLGILGSAVAVALRGMDNNMYVQVGIVLIIALASKNAILIVEYARQLRETGVSINEAAALASRRRFRPILMTSFAFILGVYPLVNAHGAGAISRRALGTAVFGGMIASTLLAVGFVPVFYVIWQNVSEFFARHRHKHPETEAEPEPTETVGPAIRES